MQFTKLRSGLHPAPVASAFEADSTNSQCQRQRQPIAGATFHKSESFLHHCEVVRGSCRAGRVPAKCHFGGLKPALRL